MSSAKVGALWQLRYCKRIWFDDLICFHAGLIIGAEGRPSVSAMGLETLPNAPRFDLEESRKIGPDTLQIWTRR